MRKATHHANCFYVPDSNSRRWHDASIDYGRPVCGERLTDRGTTFLPNPPLISKYTSALLALFVYKGYS